MKDLCNCQGELDIKESWIQIKGLQFITSINTIPKYQFNYFSHVHSLLRIYTSPFSTPYYYIIHNNTPPGLCTIPTRICVLRRDEAEATLYGGQKVGYI